MENIDCCYEWDWISVCGPISTLQSKSIFVSSPFSLPSCRWRWKLYIQCKGNEKQANAFPFLPLTSPTVCDVEKEKKKIVTCKSTLTWFDVEEWVVAKLSHSVQTPIWERGRELIEKIFPKSERGRDMRERLHEIWGRRMNEGNEALCLNEGLYEWRILLSAFSSSSISFFLKKTWYKPWRGKTPRHRRAHTGTTCACM